MASLTEVVDMINDILEDDEKAREVIQIAVDSDNDMIRDLIIQLWTTLLLVHGDEIATTIEDINKNRKDEIERKESQESEIQTVMDKLRELRKHDSDINPIDRIREKYRQMDRWDDKDRPDWKITSGYPREIEWFWDGVKIKD